MFVRCPKRELVRKKIGLRFVIYILKAYKLNIESVVVMRCKHVLSWKFCVIDGVWWWILKKRLCVKLILSRSLYLALSLSISLSVSFHFISIEG